MLVVEQRGVRVERDRIARWQAVCGDTTPPEWVPLCVPEILFLGLMGRLVTDRAFPLSPLGLIHVAQRIALHAPLVPGEPLDLRCRVAEARRDSRGIELDIAMHVISAGRVSWEGTATMLSRAPGVRGRHGAAPSPPPAWEHAVELDVPEDTGRRYARVSDDWNPHHLWPLTARPLGFRRPIAHGMWTLARTIGVLGDAVPANRAVRLEARFKRPLPMPGRARFAWTGALTDPDGVQFEVRSTAGDAVHLVGHAS